MNGSRRAAHVFISGRRQKKLDEAVTAIGSNVTGVQAIVVVAGRLDDWALR
jgi:hypothetical protein